MAIGKTTADSPLDIEVTGAPANLIVLKMVDNSTGTGDHIGMQQSLGGTHNESVKGIETFVSNTGNGLHTGTSTSVQNGTGNQVGNRTTVNGSFGTNSIFSGSIFNSGAASSAIQTGLSLSVEQPSSQISYGIFNSLNASGANATRTKYGIYNLIDTGSGDHFGVYNDVRGMGANTKYGTYNLFGIGTTDTGGVLYGNYNSFGSSITSTLDKYGNYTLIPSTLAGTHYGSYADVQNATGYAGYFIGRVSMGNTTSNRYTMPAADGGAGEVLTAAGDGTTSWSAPGGSGATPSIVRVSLGADFIPTLTPVFEKLTFDTEHFDTNNEFSTTTNRFTATSDGYYRIHTNIFANGMTVSGSYTQLVIYVNGFLHQSNWKLLTSAFSLTTSGIVSLTAGDFVEIYIRSTGGGTVKAGNQLTFFEIQQIN